jgi:hypothetical protein
MTGTNCDLFTHKSSRSYLNHLVSLFGITSDKFNADDDNNDDNADGEDDYPQYIYLVESATVKTT